MFGISIFELLVIAVVALVFVGPKRLPELMRQGGKLFVQLRRTANDVKSQFDSVINQAEEEIRKVEREKFLKLLEIQQELHKPLISDGKDEIPEHPAVEYHPFEEPPYPSEVQQDQVAAPAGQSESSVPTLTAASPGTSIDAQTVAPTAGLAAVVVAAPLSTAVKVSPPPFDTPGFPQSSGQSDKTPADKKQES